MRTTAAAVNVLSDLGRALHSGAHDTVPRLAQLDQTAVFGSRLGTHLNYLYGQLKIEVVDRTAEQLGPYGAARGAVAANKGVDADGGAHARKLGAERRVRSDVLGMRLSELLEQGAEDGELGLEGLRVGRPQCRAVRGILRRRETGAVKRSQANAFARHFSLL